MNKQDSWFMHCHAWLEGHDKIDSELINRVVEERIRNSPFPPHMTLSDSEVDGLVKSLERYHSIRQAVVTVIQEDNIVDWIQDDQIFPRWNRYELYLAKNSPGFPIASLHQQTKLILNHCMNPKKPGAWDVRGMVVGHVQSGKTANYVGLINRALDAGYKVIIVLAGIHNALREQTQGRIDSGVIGRESTDVVLGKVNTAWVGVGELDQSHAIQCLTSKPYLPRPNSEKKIGGDFNKNIKLGQNARIGGEDPWIFVIKKNKSVLENLITWLGSFRSGDEKQLSNIPALIIDDEADHASVNSGAKDDPKTINRLVRALTALFEKSTFVGYTATPYANMFIPQDWLEDYSVKIGGAEFQLGKDLFPGDFIVNIEPGSNYIGSELVFGRAGFNEDDKGVEGIPVFKLVSDAEPPEGQSGGAYIPLKQTGETELPTDIPESLKEAIRSFVVVVACRLARGQTNKHNSMLVNVAYRVAWIDEIAYLIQDYVDELKQGIIVGDPQTEKELLSLYQSEFLVKTGAIKAQLPYDDTFIEPTHVDSVKNHLRDALLKIEVRAVHGKLKGVKVKPLDLNYGEYKKDGLSVIAVGGGKLSRGLTLEDLSISYFLRTTRMYDSLMQMGRWFGYRPGYADLCRIYTTHQLYQNFKYITMVTEEVRSTFRDLTLLKKRPRDFQLKVRTDVTGAKMLITAPNRMRDSWLQAATFGGKTVQTYQFQLQKEVQIENFKLQNKILSQFPVEVLTSGRQGFSGFMGKGVNSRELIEMLYDWKHSDDLRYTFNSVLNYWKQQIESKSKFENCSIYFPSSSKNRIGKISDKVKSSGYCRVNEEDNPSSSIVRIDEREYEVRTFYRTLTDSGKGYLATTTSNSILDNSMRNADCTVPEFKGDEGDRELLEQRKELGPLVVILPLEQGIDTRLDQDIPLLGLGIVFPHLDDEVQVQYAVNKLIGWDDDIDFESDDTVDDE